MTSAFEKRTGVKTSFVRLSSGETTARLEAFKSNPEFGVWHGGPVDGFGVARIKGLIESYASPSRNMIPKNYKDADGYWTGVYVGALGFCSNTDVLKKLGVSVPTSWAALLDSKLKGQVSTAHPATSGTAFTSLWTNVTRLGEKDALAYHASLHKNVLYYTKSGVGPVAIVGRGEAAVGLVFSHDCVFGAEQGYPLKVSFPSEGTGYEIGGVALIKGAKNPDAAKAYVDFTLSTEAQNLGVGVGAYQILTNPYARKDSRMVKLSKLKIVDYDFDKAAAAKTALTAKFDADIINRSQVKS
jgi:iron(III) transport system substrate-binding protein